MSQALHHQRRTTKRQWQAPATQLELAAQATQALPRVPHSALVPGRTQPLASQHPPAQVLAVQLVARHRPARQV